MGDNMKNLLEDSFFDDINGHSLDFYQRKIVLNTSNSLLVVAGAGSGKTLTIIGKIKYLIEKENIKSQDILCISFTNATVDNLKKKVGYPIDCFTFHKLSLTLLNDFNYNFRIANDNMLDYITGEFILSFISILNLQNMLEAYLKHIFNLHISYTDIVENDKYFLFIKNQLKTFIKQIKTNGLTHDNFLSIWNISSKYDKYFLLLMFNLYLVYEEELKSINAIDFDDMIQLANDLVKNGKIKRKYKYIIIDEYQDTSLIRFKLIKSIVEVTSSKLMCVGDDYQSIYGFSGSKIELFVNFYKYFHDSKILFLKNVYRNSKEITKVSGKFIQKNRKQILKKLVSPFHLKKPIYIIYYHSYNYLEKYKGVLNYFKTNNMHNIMIIGRYNRDLNDVRNINDDVLNLSYFTAHTSKGLEEDNVLILRMDDSYLGFPSKIDNSSVLKLLSYEEKYPYAEERRLFYVALTRTKNRVYILVDKDNPSCFIEEIKRYTYELIV